MPCRRPAGVRAGAFTRRLEVWRKTSPGLAAPSRLDPQITPLQGSGASRPLFRKLPDRIV